MSHTLRACPNCGHEPKPAEDVVRHLLAETPTITAPEIVAQTGFSLPWVYRVAKKMGTPFVGTRGRKKQRPNEARDDGA